MIMAVYYENNNIVVQYNEINRIIYNSIYYCYNTIYKLKLIYKYNNLSKKQI